eukprot:6497729-Prymnesium_polylepis.1
MGLGCSGSSQCQEWGANGQTRKVTFRATPCEPASEASRGENLRHARAVGLRYASKCVPSPMGLGCY